MGRRKAFLLSVVLLCGLAAAGAAPAQAAGNYDLSWWTVDGGGDTFSTGGNYTLGSTIAQPDAGVLSDGIYRLSGGFWAWVAEADKGHLPSILYLLLLND